MWAAKWNVLWSLKTILCSKLSSRIWHSCQESKLGNKEPFTVINWSWDDMVLSLTALTQCAGQRDSETLEVTKTNNNTFPRGCLLSLSACVHFTQERKCWQQQLKCGNSQHLERPWKKVRLIVMIIKPINSGMLYKSIYIFKFSFCFAVVKQNAF